MILTSFPIISRDPSSLDVLIVAIFCCTRLSKHLLCRAGVYVFCRCQFPFLLSLLLPQGIRLILEDFFLCSFDPAVVFSIGTTTSVITLIKVLSEIFNLSTFVTVRAVSFPICKTFSFYFIYLVLHFVDCFGYF